MSRQRSKVRRVETPRSRALLPGASADDRWAAGELVDLAGELARAERDDRRLTVKSIAPGYVDRARQHEPGGCACWPW
jgi:hypothetical protein